MQLRKRCFDPLPVFVAAMAVMEAVEPTSVAIRRCPAGGADVPVYADSYPDILEERGVGTVAIHVAPMGIVGAEKIDRAF